MPAEYFSQIVRQQVVILKLLANVGGNKRVRQLCSLLGEDKLRDTAVVLRGSRFQASSFLLSLVSPVLRKMVCGDFKESACKEILLDDIKDKTFVTLLRLACGDDRVNVEGIGELFEVGGLAERLGIAAALTVVEDMLLSELECKICSEMLRRSEMSGLQRVQRHCHVMLRDYFLEASKTEAFLELSEETLGELLEDDELGVVREEETYEALMRWITANCVEGLGGEELLRKIRYGVMDDKYVASIVGTALPANRLHRELVGEAMTKKGTQGSKTLWDGVERLCDKCMVARKGHFPVVNLPAGTILGANVLDDPRCVALDREGRIIVSDADLHQIVVFNSDGSVARRLGSYGTAAGQFDWPMGVAVDRQGRIVVADRCNHRIQVLNADGSVACCFGSRGTAVGQLKDPFSVAVDREGRIVVAEYENHRVQVFNEDGSVARHFGSQGAAVGQLNGPVSVAVDGTGHIVVADRGNNRVQVFNGDGSVALCFGSKGNAPGQLSVPKGVAVDREGRFVVADFNNHRIQVFDSDGKVVRVIGATGDGVGQLIYPYGVAVDGAGRILVVECLASANHRVQVF